MKVAGQSENVWFNSEKASVLDGEWQVSCGNVSESIALPAKLVAMGYTDIVEFGGTLDWPGEIEK